ncbi:MAG: PaaI family thioesterase [Alphaproteobacteria bacterium]
MAERAALISIADFSRLALSRPWYGTWTGARPVAIEHGFARLEMRLDRPEFLRAGDSVAGPILMGMADMAMYAAVISIHERGLESVTSDMTMHFLRRPRGAVLIGEAHVLKPGKRLIVLESRLFIDADPAPVCQVTGTYAIPGA